MSSYPNGDKMYCQTSLIEKILLKDTHYHQQLLQALASPEHLSQMLRFTLSGSGCREHHQLLHCAVFRAAVCSALIAVGHNKPIAMMVTASHNPSYSNGFKIGYTDDTVIEQSVYKEIEDCLNSSESFKHYLTANLPALQHQPQQRNQPVCFVGRDTRPSSPQLSQIVQQAFQLLQIKYINIGICTTPQLYSFAKFLVNLSINCATISSNIETLKHNFVQESMSAFEEVYQKLTANCLTTKPQILIDFSNGSCAISAQPYLPTLSKYFGIHPVHHQQLQHPNHQCGAEYLSNNWHIVSSPQYSAYSYLVFFDGDADRIIMKVSPHCQCFNGNYFLMLYTKTLSKIIKQLREVHHIDTSSFALSAASSYLVNLGVKQELNNIGVPCLVSDVGVQNVFRELLMKNTQISVFFQPNGHGGVYFSPSSIARIVQLSANHPQILQLKLLQAFYLILRNNSRGYALHNMLTFFMCINYLAIDKLSDLFRVTHETNQNIFVKLQCDCLFANKDKQLTQPKKLIADIKTLQQTYQAYPIVIRKSQTEKALIRVTVQGAEISICRQIIGMVIEAMAGYGYIVDARNRQKHK